MKENPLVSVIIPVYKVEKYLHRCLDSVINQTHRNLEIILVDDGSPDNCPAICDEYAKKDSRIKVIHRENGGVSAARNTGINISTGDIIGFVDSDDYIDLDMYADMVKFMRDNELDIVCTDTVQVKGSKKKFKPRYDSDKIFLDDKAYCEILSGNIDSAVWNKIYKRDIVKSIKFPVNWYFEDVATIYKFICTATRVGYLCKPHYYYVKRQGSYIANSFQCKNRYDCFKGYRERLEFAQKKGLPCISACKKQAIETALATMTAFYANGEDSKSDRYKDVAGFIDSQINLCDRVKLKGKHKFLLWTHENCCVLHKLYAKMSLISKLMHKISLKLK